MTGVETTHDALDEYIERYSNWGRWGDADECGTANHITPQMVRDAAALVRTGEVVGLGLEFNQNGPQTGANGRFNCLRYSVATGSDHAQNRQLWGGGPIPRQMGYADDTVVLHLQSATHWDSLCHIFHRGRMFNGYPADEFTAQGAARNGAEALRVARTTQPDVVTMDLTMPEMDGVDCISELLRLLPRISILVVSALADKSTAIQALRLGARGFLAKPFSDDELKIALLDVMEGK